MTLKLVFERPEYVILAVKKKEIWFFFRNPVSDFVINHSEDEDEDGDEDDIIAVTFETDSPPSVGFFLFHYRKLVEYFVQEFLMTMHFTYSKFKELDIATF